MRYPPTALNTASGSSGSSAVGTVIPAPNRSRTVFWYCARVRRRSPAGTAAAEGAGAWLPGVSTGPPVGAGPPAPGMSIAPEQPVTTTPATTSLYVRSKIIDSFAHHLATPARSCLCAAEESLGQVPRSRGAGPHRHVRLPAAPDG